MKKIKYLIVAFVLLVISCNKDEVIEHKSTQAITEKIEVENGVLSFSSKDLLSETIKGLKEISDQEKEVELASFYKKGFMPLYPYFKETDDERIKQFSERKQSRLQKITSLNLQARMVIDEDGEVVEEFDDDLISDDEFAAILNDEREVIVGDTLYKYTYSGMFSVHKNDKPILDNYIEENNIEFLEPDPNTLVRGETKPTPKITQSLPTEQKMLYPSDCFNGVEEINQPNVLTQYFEDDCNSTGGGTTGGGSSTPPAKNNKPITKAKVILRLADNKAATNAPTKVPRACAKNGNRKCFGSNKCIAAFKPSVVFVSAPSGGGMIEPLIMIMPILTVLPIIKPAISAKMFLSMGCIVLGVG